MGEEDSGFDRRLALLVNLRWDGSGSRPSGGGYQAFTPLARPLSPAVLALGLPIGLTGGR